MTKLLLLLPLAIACNESAAARTPDQTPSIHPDLAVAVAAPTPEVLSLTGKVVADQRAEITADVQGRVVEVLVDRGQRVKRGQAVIKLDVGSAALGTQEAAAHLTAARTDQQLAAIECDRAKQLYAAGAISRSELDRQGATCASAVQQVNAARARTAIVAKSVKDGIVRAPFDGIVSERAISVGEWVTPGRALFTLVDADPLKVELAVPEASVPSVSLEQEVTISTVAHSTSYRAYVTRVAAEIGRSRSLTVEATVDGRSALVPGMFVEAELVTGQVVLPTVPATAVVKRGKTWHAFVVTRGALEERIVELGPTPANGRVSIVQNIQPGELVVETVTDQITDGLSVE